MNVQWSKPEALTGPGTKLAGLSFAAGQSMSPQLVWALLSYFKAAAGRGGAQNPVPVMFEAKLDESGKPVIPNGVHITAGSSDLFSPYFTGFVPLNTLPIFGAQVKRFTIGVTDMPVTGKQWKETQPPTTVDQQSNEVVIGIIDHGFAFLNRAFCRDGLNASRIERLWDQQRGYPTKPMTAKRQWRSVNQFAYGRELDNTTPGVIDRWLARVAGKVVTEEQAYRELQYEPSYGIRAHGTHVMGLAAGPLPDTPADEASKCSIIAVQLPAVPSKDTSGTGLAKQILDAVAYIHLHAKGRKVVINLSDGGYAGPQDGSSMLARALDKFLGFRGERCAMVVAAGNQFDQRLHWQDQVPGKTDQSDGMAQPIVWNVLPDDATDSHLEIWPQVELSPEQMGQLEVIVTPPGGPSSPPIGIGRLVQLEAGSHPGKTIGAVIYVDDAANACATGKTRPMIHVAVRGTLSTTSSRAVAPFGLWKIELMNSGEQPISFDAYVGRDNPALGDRGPMRQSHFVHESYRRDATLMKPAADDVGDVDHHGKPSPIKRMGHLNSVALSKEVVVVGGYRCKSHEPASYSAAGNSSRMVDGLAKSDESWVSRGVWGPAVRSGVLFRMDGTSAAAPQVTRAIANWMSTGKSIQAPWPQFLAAAQAQPPGSPISVKDPRTGFGRLA